MTKMTADSMRRQSWRRGSERRIIQLVNQRKRLPEPSDVRGNQFSVGGSRALERGFHLAHQDPLALPVYSGIAHVVFRILLSKPMNNPQAFSLILLMAGLVSAEARKSVV